MSNSVVLFCLFGPLFLFFIGRKSSKLIVFFVWIKNSFTGTYRGEISFFSPDGTTKERTKKERVKLRKKKEEEEDNRSLRHCCRKCSGGYAITSQMVQDNTRLIQVCNRRQVEAKQDTWSSRQ